MANKAMIYVNGLKRQPTDEVLLVGTGIDVESGPATVFPNASNITIGDAGVTTTIDGDTILERVTGDILLRGGEDHEIRIPVDETGQITIQSGKNSPLNLYAGIGDLVGGQVTLQAGDGDDGGSVLIDVGEGLGTGGINGVISIGQAIIPSEIIIGTTGVPTITIDAVNINIGNIDSNIKTIGNLICGPDGALTTSATKGFVYTPTMPGTPTGIPTAYAGKSALVWDSTNDALYIYDGGWINIVGDGSITFAKLAAAVQNKLGKYDSREDFIATALQTDFDLAVDDADQTAGGILAFVNGILQTETVDYILSVATSGVDRVIFNTPLTAGWNVSILYNRENS